MTVGFNELVEKLPTGLRRLRADQQFERCRPVSGLRKFLDQRAEHFQLLWIADEIEPRQVKPFSFAAREGRDAALDCRLHQCKHVPGHRTPGRSDQGILLFVESQVVEKNLDNRAAVGEGLISDRPRGFLRPEGFTPRNRSRISSVAAAISGSWVAAFCPPAPQRKASAYG